jgi:hypothetical protein
MRGTSPTVREGSINAPQEPSLTVGLMPLRLATHFYPHYQNGESIDRSGKVIHEITRNDSTDGVCFVLLRVISWTALLANNLPGSKPDVSR